MEMMNAENCKRTIFFALSSLNLTRQTTTVMPSQRMTRQIIGIQGDSDILFTGYTLIECNTADESPLALTSTNVTFNGNTIIRNTTGNWYSGILQLQYTRWMTTGYVTIGGQSSWFWTHLWSTLLQGPYNWYEHINIVSGQQLTKEWNGTSFKQSL